MPATVRLNDIVDALEMQIDESSSFLDCDTGEVVTVSHDLLREVEESGDREKPDLAAWQKQEIARRIISTDRFQELPTKFDVHEWGIMQDFSRSAESDRVCEDLLHAIHGAGAFRNFKDTLQRHGIESAWFAFRTEALRQIAQNWCEENHIVGQLFVRVREMIGPLLHARVRCFAGASLWGSAVLWGLPENSRRLNQPISQKQCEAQGAHRRDLPGYVHVGRLRYFLCLAKNS
jgi:hypothetical protein